MENSVAMMSGANYREKQTLFEFFYVISDSVLESLSPCGTERIERNAHSVVLGR